MKPRTAVRETVVASKKAVETGEVGNRLIKTARRGALDATQGESTAGPARLCQDVTITKPIGGAYRSRVSQLSTATSTRAPVSNNSFLGRHSSRDMQGAETTGAVICVLRAGPRTEGWRDAARPVEDWEGAEVIRTQGGR